MGHPAKPHAGATLVSVTWREVSARAHEVAAVLSRSHVCSYDAAVIRRHCAKIASAATRAYNAASAEMDALGNFAKVFERALSSKAICTIKSLAALATKRAIRIESAVCMYVCMYVCLYLASQSLRTSPLHPSAPGLGD